MKHRRVGGTCGFIQGAKLAASMLYEQAEASGKMEPVEVLAVIARRRAPIGQPIEYS